MSKKLLHDALQKLVALKRWKDTNGKDMHYVMQQPIAWEQAEQALMVTAQEECKHDFVPFASGVAICTICDECKDEELIHV